MVPPPKHWQLVQTQDERNELAALLVRATDLLDEARRTLGLIVDLWDPKAVRGEPAYAMYARSAIFYIDGVLGGDR